MSLFNVFVHIVLPVIIVVAWGYVLGRRSAIDVKSVSRVALFAFSPCLVFSSLVQTSLSGAQAANVWGFVLTITACMGLLAWFISHTLRLSQSQETAFMLATMFNNAGNFGLPLLLFAFGEAGMQQGLVYFVASAFLTNTLGSFIASRGKSGLRGALRAMVSMPVFYATFAALACNLAHITPPDWVLKPVTLLGDASVPAMELILGMQLARTSIQKDLRLAGLASFVALAASTALAFAIAPVWGLRGLVRKVCIVETATPTAVMTTVLATEFDAEPGFVTSVVFLTTMASVLSVTVVLKLLL